MDSENRRILVISDLHSPYWHPDTVAFLAAVKSALQPDRVIQVGDEVDGHSWSFHEHDPDLLSPGAELKKAIEKLRHLYEMFPEVDLLESNHGSLIYRKGVFHGIPRGAFKSYKEILDAPSGWSWHFDLTITMSNGMPVYFTHGKSASPLALSQSMGMSAVQGHYHEKFAINYWANSLGLYWQMQVGCLINDRELAYNYNNTNLKRPIIGVGAIVDGHPHLVPMVLNSDGRWINRLV